MIRAMEKMLAPLRTRLANLVSRAVLARVDDSAKLQTVQVNVLAEETRDGVERFQNYGFTSVPLEGAEAVVVFVGGRRDHGLALAVDDRRHRLSGLQPGEVAVYSETGAAVVLKADGSVEVTPGTGAVVKLAGDTDAVAKGAALNSAVATLGSAIAAAFTGMAAGGPASPLTGAQATAAATAVTTAVTVFNTSAQAALSTKVKLS